MRYSSDDFNNIRFKYEQLLAWFDYNDEISEKNNECT